MKKAGIKGKFLIAAAVAMMLTGCGQTSESTGESTQEDTQPVNVQEETAGGGGAKQMGRKGRGRQRMPILPGKR